MAWKNIGVNNVVESSSQWQGKKWTVIGDSNTEANAYGTDQTKYHGLLAVEKGMTSVQNLGKSGSGWFNTWKTGYEAYYKRLSAIDTDADLITLLGGGNDYAETEKPLVLGALGDTDPVATFYGAIDNTLSTLIELRPNAKIAVISQFRRNVGTPTNEKLENMVKAQREVCEKYGIPFLDLYHQANMYPWLTWWRSRYMTDGVHLNEQGHMYYLKPKIIHWLEMI